MSWFLGSILRCLCGAPDEPRGGRGGGRRRRHHRLPEAEAIPMIQHTPTIQSNTNEYDEGGNMALVEQLQTLLAPAESEIQGSMTTTEAQLALASVINLLATDHLKMLVVMEILGIEQRRRRKQGKKFVKIFLANIIGLVMSQEQQVELCGILSDLPPACMGDKDSQQHSRVLVSVRKDVKTAKSEWEIATSLAHKSVVRWLLPAQPCPVDTVGGAVRQFIQDRADGDELLAGLLSSLPSEDGFRLIMMQILLSRTLPADTIPRKDVLVELFSQQVVEDAMEETEPRDQLPPVRTEEKNSTE